MSLSSTSHPPTTSTLTVAWAMGVPPVDEVNPALP